jgi:ribose 1,5-bisphosphate isomerase
MAPDPPRPDESATGAGHPAGPGDATAAEGRDVITAILRNGGRVLVLQRSDAVAEFPGRWAFVSGAMETDDPERDARREIAEETGLDDAVSLVRTGRPLTVRDGDRTWTVHPLLFDCDRRSVALNPESAAAEWVPPTAVLRREAVPDAWEAYAAVAPSVGSITADADHGAATLSIRALDVLRDRAGLLAASEDDGWPELADLARRLRTARPGMAPLRNRIDRAMAVASGLVAADWPIESIPGVPQPGEGDEEPADDPTPAAVERAAIAGIERALCADRRAAAHLAARIADETVLTVSRSGTVERALRRGSPEAVYVARSDPGGEGVHLAEALATADTGPPTVTLHADAAMAHVLADSDVDRVVVGSDALLPDGRAINKVGTRTAAVAATREGVPTTVAAATDKLRPDGTVRTEQGPRSEIYDGDSAIEVHNPTFDVAPADTVEILTERGLLDPAELRDIADDIAALADWME